MRCEVCGNTTECVLTRLTDKNRSLTLCPNCIALGHDRLQLENCEYFVDEITGKNGAVLYESFGERYRLDAETMLRLLAHNLKPEEYLALVERHDPYAYMLHEDFYSDDGVALQPTI